MNSTRIHLFEYGDSGHHAKHLKALAMGWPKIAPAGAVLRLTVTPRLVAREPDFVGVVNDLASTGVELDVLPAALDRALQACKPVTEAAAWWVLGSGPPEGSLARVQWEMAAERADASGADHMVFMELDPVFPALAAHLPCPAAVSGLWFKPAFLYATGERPAWALHEKVLLVRGMAHPRLHRIFSMDADLVDRLAAQGPQTPFRYLPHVVSVPASPAPGVRAETRRRLGIAADQFAFLFFGQIARRKGFFEVVAATKLLPAERRRRIVLIFAGARNDIDAAAYAAAINSLRSAGIRVVVRDAFVDDDEAEQMFEAADAVLAAYIRHLGTSDIVVRAAAHGLPVLSQDYGAMGSLVRRHRLGMAVNTLDAAEIAGAMARLVEGDLAGSFDAATARAFAQSHEAAGFARTFFAAFGFAEAEAEAGRGPV